jgi:holo-[acyl-carrier protein] synthase
MNIKTGIDIIHIDNIRKLSESSISKLFTSKELTDTRPDHLAGIFAAKEAFFKAIGAEPKWLEIEINKEKSGRPYIVIFNELKKNIRSSDLSISHDGNYAIASVIIIKNGE